jgi:hypothetical protein
MKVLGRCHCGAIVYEAEVSGVTGLGDDVGQTIVDDHLDFDVWIRAHEAGDGLRIESIAYSLAGCSRRATVATFKIARPCVEGFP